MALPLNEHEHRGSVISAALFAAITIFYLVESTLFARTA